MGKGVTPIPRWELPESWEWTELGEAMTVIRGASPRPKGDPRYFGGSIPWIMIADVTRAEGKYLMKTRETVTEAGADKSRYLPKGALILSNSGTVCVPKFLGVPGCIHDGFVTFPDIPDCFDQQFLYQFFKHLRPIAIRTYKQGVTQVNLNTEIVRSIPLPIPPEAEQARIVSAIESLQDRSTRARDLLSEVGPLIGQLRQSVLRSAFSGDLTSEWRQQNPDVLPASELLQRIRTERRQRWEAEQLAKYEAKGKKPPKNWQDKYREPEPCTEEELEILHDQNLPNGWAWGPAELIVEPEAEIVYGIVQPGKKLDEGVPYVRGKDIINGVIQVDQLLKTSEEIAAKYERASLNGGDILLGIIRATKVAIVPDVLKGANITQGTARFRPSNIIRTGFLAYWLDSPNAQDWLHSHYRGIDMPGLNLRDVRRLPIPIAPLDEQEAVEKQAAKAVASVTSVRDSVTSMESSLTQLDQSILSKAFRGELVPQNPNDEPASELLARIKAAREQAEEAKKAAKQKKKGSKSRRATTSQPKIVQVSLESIAFDLLLILQAWNKPVSIWILESALALMQRDDLISKFKKTRSSKQKPKQIATPILKDMQSVILGYLVGGKVIKPVGKNGYELIDDSPIKNASKEKRDKARAAIAALEHYMNRRELDEQQARDAIAAQVGTTYEIKTEVPA